jgi:hypothetical protein
MPCLRSPFMLNCCAVKFHSNTLLLNSEKHFLKRYLDSLIDMNFSLFLAKHHKVKFVQIINIELPGFKNKINSVMRKAAPY